MAHLSHNDSYLIPGFVGLILILLALDLFLFRRKNQILTLSQAAGWSTFWVTIAIAFNAWIFWYLGKESALTFATGYIIEMSLSVDNLFVFILIFASFKPHPASQHRILFWGIIGALILRALCITVGVAALQKFVWLEYLFATLLIWAGIKTMIKAEETEKDPTKGRLVSFFRKMFPIKGDYEGKRFFVRDNGKWFATPLFLVLLLIEASDVIFAVDSIPAVLAITKDPFLVYSSNIFAILGLRSLYFVLVSLMHSFRYLATGVSFILISIGLKMGTSHWIDIPVSWTLGFIAVVLTLAIAASLLIPQKTN